MERLKNKIVFFVIGFVFILVLQWGLLGFSYPVVKIVVASGKVDEMITVFFKGEDEVFSDQNMLSQVIKKERKETYYFEIAERTECLRIDVGSSEGDVHVYSVEVLLSPFQKCVIDISEETNFSYSADVENVSFEENMLILTSSGKDPFFIVNEISSEKIFYFGGIIQMFLSLIISFLILGVVIVFCNCYKTFFQKMVDCINKKRTAIKIVMIMVVVSIFFSLPVLFTYDSSTYMAYLPFFEGKLPLVQWGKTRGWGFPLFLWFSENVFGGTAYGISIALFLIYLIFLIYIYNIVLKIERWRSKDWVVVIVGGLFLLNPIFLGYYHLILTESLAATISCVAVYKIIAHHKKEVNGFDLKRMFAKICMVATTSMILYFIKQMFFVIPIIAYVLSELLLCVTTKKRFWKPFLGVVCSFCMLASSISIWNGMIDSGREGLQTDESMMKHMNISSSDAFSSYLKKGAIYFEESGDFVLVMDDGTIIDRIDNNTNSSFFYILKCLFSHPLVLLQGYVDNYLILANIYTLDVPDNYHMSEADIIKDVSFTRGLENMALALYPRYYSYINNTYEEFGFTETLIPYGQYVDTNVVTETLYSKEMIVLTNFLYSISIVYAPFSFLIHFIALFFRDGKKQNDKNQIIIIMSGTVFLYGVAMSMMCMRIDRYMFPVFAFGLIVVLLDLKSVIGTFVMKVRTFLQERSVT